MLSCKQLFWNKGLNCDLKIQVWIHHSIVPEKGGLCQAEACGDCGEATSPCCSFWLLDGSEKWGLHFCPNKRIGIVQLLHIAQLVHQLPLCLVALEQLNDEEIALLPYICVKQSPSKQGSISFCKVSLKVFGIHWIVCSDPQSVSVYVKAWVNFNACDCGQGIRFPVWWTLRGDSLRWQRFLSGCFPLQQFCSYFLPFLIPGLDSTDASGHRGWGHVCFAFVSKDTIYHGE